MKAVREIEHDRGRDRHYHDPETHAGSLPRRRPVRPHRHRDVTGTPPIRHAAHRAGVLPLGGGPRVSDRISCSLRWLRQPRRPGRAVFLRIRVFCLPRCARLGTTPRPSRLWRPGCSCPWPPEPPSSLGACSGARCGGSGSSSPLRTFSSRDAALGLGRLVRHDRRREIVIALLGLVWAFNVVGVIVLVVSLVAPSGAQITGRQLLVSGIAVWLIDAVAFGLAFWELDCGGPSPVCSRRGRASPTSSSRRTTTRTREGGLGATSVGLLLRLSHQLDRVQPDRHDAAHTCCEDIHGGGVDSRRDHTPARRRTRGQHPRVDAFFARSRPAAPATNPGGRAVSVGARLWVNTARSPD